MHSELELENLRKKLVSMRNMEKLPSEAAVFEQLESTIKILKGESKKYRPLGKDKFPGGLLDFCGSKCDVIVVPDLHARPDFLMNLIDFRLNGSDVLKLLDEGSLMVVCVGDGVHTETPGRCHDRWLGAYEKWKEGQVESPEMAEEILEAFQTMFVVMELKKNFPSGFHFLKGNHENVLNRSGDGDYGFRKIAMEGQMVYDFLESYYSQATAYVISEFERSLPIVAIFDRFGISHGEPCRSFDRKDIIDFHRHPEVIIGFTWTDNGDAQDGSVLEQFHELNRKGDRDNCFWLGGHRPVAGKYLLRQDGVYIQIHNPREMNVAWIHSDGSFSLESDIFSVERKGDD